jgi:hypothetical protein
LPVAKLLDAPPSNNRSQPVPVIQIKTDEPPVRRADPLKPVPVDEQELRSRRRRVDVLFYALVVAGSLALGGIGALMLMHI